MNKEKAYKQLEKSCKELARFKRYDLEIGFSDNQALTIIKQALTQPTAEEVCKAFKVWYEKDNDKLERVSYNEENKTFSYVWIYDNKPMRFTICQLSYGNINFVTNVPPHLITMIGRFYEGVDVDE